MTAIVAIVPAVVLVFFVLRWAKYRALGRVSSRAWQEQRTFDRADGPFWIRYPRDNYLRRGR